MDFTPDDLDGSPPCFFVDNSQIDDSQHLFRSCSDQHLKILKQLPISTRVSSENATTSTAELDGLVVLGDLRVVRYPVTNRGGGEEEDPKREQGDGGQRHEGSGSGDDNAGGQDAGGDGGGGNGGPGGGGDGAGGGGGDDGDDEGGQADDNGNGDHDQEEEEEETSSESVPQLPQQESTINGFQHDSSFSGRDSEDNYSQASTAVVRQSSDVGGDLSEASTSHASDEKKSSTASDRKSEKDSSVNSSSYHGDLSSLSSGTSSLPTSPDIRKHLPLPSMVRTQSTSDTSTSSAGSKEDKTHTKITGFKLISIEEKATERYDTDVCSSQEDLFASSQGHQEKQKGHEPGNLSEEDTRFLSPQHRSTPVKNDNREKIQGQHVSEKSLYRQALTKHRTSTPLKETPGEFLPTPPSQGTPIDRFNSLQLSGEVVIQQASSSSSSERIPPSPEASSSVPLLIPSSPTAQEEKQDNAANKRESKRSPRTGMDEMAKKDGLSRRLSEEKTEISRAAEPLLRCFDMDQSRHIHAGHPSQLTGQKRKLEDIAEDEDEFALPRWQQEMPRQDSTSCEVEARKKVSSDTSSSEGHSSSDALQRESSQPMQQWQSLDGVFESSSSVPEGKAVRASELANTASSSRTKEQFQGVLDVSSPEDNTTPRPISKVHFNDQPALKVQEQPSLSPSSLAVDPFKVAVVSGQSTKDSPPIVGPTQPDFSEDLFCPVVTQDSAQVFPASRNISEKKDDQQLAAVEPQDSHDEPYPFSLHLTQSQADVESQQPMETNQPMEDATADEVLREKDPDKSAEQGTCAVPEKDEVPSLAKQDSSCAMATQSQSILAQLVKESSRSSDVQPVMSKAIDLVDRSDEQQSAAASKDLSSSYFRPEEDEVRTLESTIQPTGEVQIGISAPEHPASQRASSGDNEKAGGGTPGVIGNVSGSNKNQQQAQSNETVRKPIKPRLPAAIFSEGSSESALGAEFHFSIPKDIEPLRPISSTTPPPMRPLRRDTPDSEEKEKDGRPTSIPDIMPVITETPGMSSQASRLPSLTLSMPRLGSQEGESEHSEPLFHFESPVQPAVSTASSSARSEPSTAESPRSLFSHARQSILKTKKRTTEYDSDNDPFAFTDSDDAPEPPMKRVKRTPVGLSRKEIGEGRDESSVHRDNHSHESGTRTDERSNTSAKELTERRREQKGIIDECANRSATPDNPRPKRSRPDDGESSKKRESEGHAKRARTETDVQKTPPKPCSSEPTRYRQITHTRVVTTVTTTIQRVVTVSLVEETSGEVIEVLSYENNELPKVESQEDENEEVQEFEMSSSTDGSRVKLTSQKQQQPPPQPRSSPRAKSGKTPIKPKTLGNAISNVSAPIQAVPESVESDKRPESSQKNAPNRQRSDDPPTITRHTTVPVLEEPTLQQSSSSDSALIPGTRVLAKWLDSFFYPGKVTAAPSKNWRCAITFDDGDRRRIPRENIIVRNVLSVGQSVMAQGEGEFDFYEEGIVVGHYRSGDERGYEVQIQSGAISRFPVSKVILSEQQAAAILSSESSLNATSGSSLSIGVHSLRARKEGSSTGSSVSPRQLSSAATRDTSKEPSSKDTTGTSSDEKTRAGRSPSIKMASTTAVSPSKDVTPKSTRKLSLKVKAQARRNGQRITESSSELSSDEPAVGAATGKRRVRKGLSGMFASKSPRKPLASEASEPRTRRSPRKQLNTENTVEAGKSSPEDELEPGPLPQDRNVFAGLAFLVTGVVKDRNELDESDSECERVAFNRRHLKRQIEAGGGVVLTSFPQSQISADDCFLISNTHQRTQKYFQSLAAGIPCVSHVWIMDCCATSKRLDYRKYLLPAGHSLEEGDIVECRPRRNIFGNMRVYLHGSQTFKNTWSSVLLAAGCKMVTKLPNRFSRALHVEELDYQYDVVICDDNKLPASVKHATGVLNIPIVSLEWLIQSLINGRQLAFDGHPKYHYKNA